MIIFRSFSKFPLKTYHFQINSILGPFNFSSNSSVIFSSVLSLVFAEGERRQMSQGLLYCVFFLQPPTHAAMRFCFLFFSLAPCSCCLASPSETWQTSVVLAEVLCVCLARDQGSGSLFGALFEKGVFLSSDRIGSTRLLCDIWQESVKSERRVCQLPRHLVLASRILRSCQLVLHSIESSAGRHTTQRETKSERQTMRFQFKKCSTMTPKCI